MTLPTGGPSDADTSRADVAIIGMLRGRRVDGEATVELLADTLHVAWRDAAPWHLSLEGVDGVTFTATDLTLYLAGGDVLSLRGDDRVRTLALQLEGHACTMPELTRGLRAFGSLRGAPGAAHDAWFGPLLAARRAVEGVSDPSRQLGVMDASSLARAMEESLAAIAAVQAPQDPARRRAVEAALEEEAEPFFLALHRLAFAADDLRGSAPDTRIAAWRRWIAALREVYAAADDGWGRAASITAR